MWEQTREKLGLNKKFYINVLNLKIENKKYKLKMFENNKDYL